MQPVTTQATTNLTTINNQTNTTHTTTLYPNDVTWESVGKYVHLFNQCWSIAIGPNYKTSYCAFGSWDTIWDKEIGYPCTALKENFSIYIQKALKLSDYICPRSDLVKTFDKHVGTYERYDDANYLNQH